MSIPANNQYDYADQPCVYHDALVLPAIPDDHPASLSCYHYISLEIDSHLRMPRDTRPLNAQPLNVSQYISPQDANVQNISQHILQQGAPPIDDPESTQVRTSSAIYRARLERMIDYTRREAFKRVIQGCNCFLDGNLKEPPPQEMLDQLEFLKNKASYFIKLQQMIEMGFDEKQFQKVIDFCNDYLKYYPNNTYIHFMQQQALQGLREKNDKSPCPQLAPQSAQVQNVSAPIVPQGGMPLTFMNFAKK
jgi:hypothetical protein